MKESGRFLQELAGGQQVLSATFQLKDYAYYLQHIYTAGWKGWEEVSLPKWAVLERWRYDRGPIPDNVCVCQALYNLCDEVVVSLGGCGVRGPHQVTPSGRVTPKWLSIKFYRIYVLFLK